MMKIPLRLWTAAVLVIPPLAAARVSAAELFSEGFDSLATTRVQSNSGTGMNVTYVNYADMLVGVTSHNIAEAPRQIAGSLPTRGVLMQVNYPATPPTAQRIANLVALDDVGGSRILFTDNYRLKFDFYLRLSTGITLSGGIPTQAGTTEQMVWGVGYTSATPMGRGTRTAAGSGTWGWLSTEGGFSATNGSDASFCTASTI